MSVFENYGGYGRPGIPKMTPQQMAQLYSGLTIQQVPHMMPPMSFQHAPLPTFPPTRPDYRRSPLPKQSRVHINQKEAFENSVILKRLSKQSTIRYVGSTEPSIVDRRKHFHESIKEGLCHVAFGCGLNLELPLQPVGKENSSESTTYNSKDEKMHIKSKLIMDGVCVLWKGTIDINSLEGDALMEFDPESAKAEDEKASTILGTHRSPDLPIKMESSPASLYVPGPSGLYENSLSNDSFGSSPSPRNVRRSSDNAPGPLNSSSLYPCQPINFYDQPISGYDTSQSNTRQQTSPAMNGQMTCAPNSKQTSSSTMGYNKSTPPDSSYDTSSSNDENDYIQTADQNYSNNMYSFDQNTMVTGNNFRLKDVHKRSIHRNSSLPYPSPTGSHIKNDADRDIYGNL